MAGRAAGNGRGGRHRGRGRPGDVPASLRWVLATGTAVAISLAATPFVLHRQSELDDLAGLSLSPQVAEEHPAVEDTTGRYTFMAHQPGGSDEPVAYDACRPLRVVVNDTLQPQGGDEVLASALAAVAEASGLEFEMAGRTDELPEPDRPATDQRRYGRGWAPILVAWTTPEQDPQLAGTVAGVGGSAPVADPKGGRAHYVTGVVSLDAPALTEAMQRPGDGRLQVRALIMHELGHLVGLGHVNDSGELMDVTNTGRTAFGVGDLQGLRRLGGASCRR